MINNNKPTSIVFQRRTQKVRKLREQGVRISIPASGGSFCCWYVLAVITMMMLPMASAFTTGPPRKNSRRMMMIHHSSSSSSSSHQPSLNSFGPFGSFLNHGRGRNQTVAFMAPMIGNDNHNDVLDDMEKKNQIEPDEELAAGTFRLMALEATTIQEPSGLFDFLVKFLTERLKTPNAPKEEATMKEETWKFDQPADTVIDVWFHDRSAVLSISLEHDDNTMIIIIDRVGSEPSTRYLIQESLVLEGLLDALTVLHDESYVVPNRLLVLSDRQAIDKYRKELSFA